MSTTANRICTLKAHEIVQATTNFEKYLEIKSIVTWDSYPKWKGTSISEQKDKQFKRKRKKHKQVIHKTTHGRKDVQLH